MRDKTLDAEEILTSHPMGRRSALATVAYGGLALVGLSAQACSRRTGCTDSDTGSVQDGVGNGRHCGCTDSDSSDSAGHGVHCGASGCTDSDPSDTAGNGRHCI